MRSRRTAAAAIAVLVAMAGACTGDDDDGAVRGARSSESTAADELPIDSIKWSDCDDLECATLTVPLDHDDPTGPTIDLALSRRPADGDAIGSLLFNPGGPGVAAVPYVAQSELLFSSDLLERFHIVTWDPRGAGESTPVDCVDNLDDFYAVDRSPDAVAEIAAIEEVTNEFVRGCAQRSGELLPHLSTADTVRDLEAIRVALVDERLNYIGFSYGTFIGSLYVDAYPNRVRAMVLDGAVDPSLDAATLSKDQAVGFDRALDAFLADCERSNCGFGGSDPRAAYDSLLAQIDAESLPAEIAGEERELGPGEADIGVATAMYSGEDGWGVLADALSEAARGDGTALLELSDLYTDRRRGGEYSNQGEAFYAIGCVDGPSPSFEEMTELAEESAADAPAFGPATIWLGSPCAVWPVPPSGTPRPILAPGAPPIVVLGTSNDPATPLRWAEGLAEQLESGVLMVWESEGHTAYGRGSACIDDAVDRYLIDLEVPDDGTTCR
ncbi:MAG: alpha/beta hydrolase [Actinomycetota bacterium]